MQHLEASVFSILAQLKILTAALFSVAMLGTHLSMRKWRALFLLVLGAVLVQWPTDAKQPAASTSEAETGRSWIIGTAAALTMVTMSGFAGIWTEKFLKAGSGGGGKDAAPPLSIWERNLQLSFWGMLFAIASFAATSVRGDAPAPGFLAGYSWLTWCIIVVAAIGGLLVAVVVRFTSTLVKGFASSASIIVTALLSLVMFPGEQLTPVFWLGALVVMAAIYQYGQLDPPSKALSDPRSPPPDQDVDADLLPLLQSDDEEAAV